MAWHRAWSSRAEPGMTQFTNAYVRQQGAVSIQRCRLTRIGIPLLKIRRSRDRYLERPSLYWNGAQVTRPQCVNHWSVRPAHIRHLSLAIIVSVDILYLPLPGHQQVSTNHKVRPVFVNIHLSVIYFEYLSLDGLIIFKMVDGILPNLVVLKNPFRCRYCLPVYWNLSWTLSGQWHGSRQGGHGYQWLGQRSTISLIPTSYVLSAYKTEACLQNSVLICFVISHTCPSWIRLLPLE